MDCLWKRPGENKLKQKLFLGWYEIYIYFSLKIDFYSKIPNISSSLLSADVLVLLLAVWFFWVFGEERIFKVSWANLSLKSILNSRSTSSKSHFLTLSFFFASSFSAFWSSSSSRRALARWASASRRSPLKQRIVGGPLQEFSWTVLSRLPLGAGASIPQRECLRAASKVDAGLQQHQPLAFIGFTDASRPKWSSLLNTLTATRHLQRKFQKYSTLIYFWAL